MGRQQTNVGAMQWMPLPNYKPGGQPIFPQPMDYRLGRDDQAPGPYMQNLGIGLPYHMRDIDPGMSPQHTGDPSTWPHPAERPAWEQHYATRGMVAPWQQAQADSVPPTFRSQPQDNFRTPIIGGGAAAPAMGRINMIPQQMIPQAAPVAPAQPHPKIGGYAGSENWDTKPGWMGRAVNTNRAAQGDTPYTDADLQRRGMGPAPSGAPGPAPNMPFGRTPQELATYSPADIQAGIDSEVQSRTPWVPRTTDSLAIGGQPLGANGSYQYHPMPDASEMVGTHGQQVGVMREAMGQQNLDTIRNYGAMAAGPRNPYAAATSAPDAIDGVANAWQPNVGPGHAAGRAAIARQIQQQALDAQNQTGMWANTGVGSRYVAPYGFVGKDAAARRYAGAPSLNPDLAAREAEYRNAVRNPQPLPNRTANPEAAARYGLKIGASDAELRAAANTARQGKLAKRQQNVQIGAAGGPIPSMLRQVARGEDMSPDERGVLGIGQALPDQNPAIMHNTYVGLAQAYATATDPKVREFLQGQLTNLGPQVFGPPQIGSAAQPPNPADVWQREQQNIDQWHAAGQNGEPPATSAKGITYAKKLGYNGTVKGYDAATGTVKPIGTGSSPPSTSPAAGNTANVEPPPAAGNTANVEPPPAAGNTANVEPPPPPEVADQIKKEIGTYHAFWPFSTGDPVANLPANIVQSYPRYIYSIMNNQWGPEQVDRYMQPHRHLSLIPPGFAPDPSNGRDEQRRYADAISSGEPRRKALLVGPQADAPQVTAIPKPPPAKPSLAPNPNSPAGKAAAKGDEKATTAGKIAAAKRANTPIKIKLGK